MKTYSTEHQAYLNKLRKERIWVFLFQFFIALLFFGIWEWLGQNHLINTFLYSYPSKMMKMISSLLFSQHLLHHIGITLFELIISFFISFCLIDYPTSENETSQKSRNYRDSGNEENVPRMSVRGRRHEENVTEFDRTEG